MVINVWIYWFTGPKKEAFAATSIGPAQETKDTAKHRTSRWMKGDSNTHELAQQTDQKIINRTAVHSQQFVLKSIYKEKKKDANN